MFAFFAGFAILKTRNPQRAAPLAVCLKNKAQFVHIYEKSRPTGKVSGIMANTIELKQQIAQGEYDAAFAKLYGADAVQEQRKRYTDLIDEFEKKYGTNRTVRLYSAPGRTEIGGNHRPQQRRGAGRLCQPGYGGRRLPE